MELLLKYFPKLTQIQQSQFAALGPLYEFWNAQINVISRKDIDHIYDHHVLHSLAIAKAINFQAGTHILDLGTGGGFPGIPLAILFPKTNFTLIDGKAKKLKVVQSVVDELGLKNVKVRHVRAEELKGVKFDFVVSRAVAKLDQLFEWSQGLISQKEKHAIPNGLIALKGGNIKEEAKALPAGTYAEFNRINDFFDLDYFNEKYVIYVQR